MNRPKIVTAFSDVIEAHGYIVFNTAMIDPTGFANDIILKDGGTMNPDTLIKVADNVYMFTYDPPYNTGQKVKIDIASGNIASTKGVLLQRVVDYDFINNNITP